MNTDELYQSDDWVECGIELGLGPVGSVCVFMTKKENIHKTRWNKV